MATKKATKKADVKAAKKMPTGGNAPPAPPPPPPPPPPPTPPTVVTINSVDIATAIAALQAQGDVLSVKIEFDLLATTSGATITAIEEFLKEAGISVTHFAISKRAGH